MILPNDVMHDWLFQRLLWWILYYKALIKNLRGNMSGGLFVAGTCGRQVLKGTCNEVAHTKHKWETRLNQGVTYK